MSEKVPRLYCEPYCWNIYGGHIREAPQKKKRENVGIFPKWGTPPPSPLFGNDTFVKKKIMVYFAFQDLRNIFGFQKNVHFWVVLWFVEVGSGDPPPPQAKNSHFIPFCYIFFTE